MKYFCAVTTWYCTLLIWSTVMTEDAESALSSCRTILNVFSPLDSNTITMAWEKQPCITTQNPWDHLVEVLVLTEVQNTDHLSTYFIWDDLRLPRRQTRGGNGEPPDLSGIALPPLGLQIGCTPSVAGSSDRAQYKIEVIINLWSFLSQLWTISGALLDL